MGNVPGNGTGNAAGRKLFVSNFKFAATAEAVRELFSQEGDVTDVFIAMDRTTGRAKGFGFIEFATPEQASSAIDTFNGFEWDGRQLSVAYARPKEGNAGRRETTSEPRGESRGDRGQQREPRW